MASSSETGGGCCSRLRRMPAGCSVDFWRLAWMGTCGRNCWTCPLLSPAVSGQPVCRGWSLECPSECPRICVWDPPGQLSFVELDPLFYLIDRLETNSWEGTKEKNGSLSFSYHKIFLTDVYFYCQIVDLLFYCENFLDMVLVLNGEIRIRVTFFNPAPKIENIRKLRYRH